jgi:SHS2 domain-containing protein
VKPPAGGPSARALAAAGRDLPELFQNAALALAGMMVDPETVSPGGLRDRLRAEAPDAETLLVRWLEKVLIQVNANRMIPAAVRVLRFQETPSFLVEGELDGELLDPGRHGFLGDVGSVRGARIVQDGDGWRADVTLDV